MIIRAITPNNKKNKLTEKQQSAKNLRMKNIAVVLMLLAFMGILYFSVIFRQIHLLSQ